MAHFEIKQSKEGEMVRLELVGQIDEDTDFSSYQFGDSGQIQMQLEGIKSINSCGIREWIKWLDTLKAAKSIEFRNCPKVIIDQMNMVEGFLPTNGRVTSFYVPYFSEDSGTEKDILFTYGKEFDEAGVHAPDEIKDEESGDVLEMDVIESKYFKFLK